MTSGGSALVADVNNRGVIAGSYMDANDRWHGFLATLTLPLCGVAEAVWATSPTAVV
jgi:hypothetical protein